MNNFLIKINNFFKVNPHKHWNFLLFIFFMLACMLVLFSFYLLYQIKNEKVFQVSIVENKDAILLKEPLLKSINEIYDKRASNVLEINSKASIYKDPSL